MNTDPPLPATPAPQRPSSMPKGPVIPMSEFTQINKFPASEASAGPLSPEVEAMVQQVTAVMPQVPYTVIRKDLSKYHFSCKLNGQLPLNIDCLLHIATCTCCTCSIEQK